MSTLSRYKVLHVITTINRGGAENHLVELVKGQLRQGIEVAVAYLKGDGYWTASYYDLGVPVINLKLYRYGNIAPIFRLRSFIQSYKPFIIHAHLQPAELYARLALLGISSEALPLIVSKHNDEPFYRGRGHRLLGRWVAKRTQKIIAISNAVRNYMVTYGLDCPRNKVITIHYGIDAQRYEDPGPEIISKFRSLFSIEDGAYLIGTVARLVSQKALHVLIQGFAMYLASAGRPAKLILVGSGPLQNDLRTFARRLGIEKNVIWAGFREDIPVIMNAVDVFALTSIYEGFGLVLLEAMSAGKPIVASHVSAIPEIVEDKTTGLLVPPERPDLLRDCFKYFEHENTRRSFGAAGRERVKSIFNLTNMIERTSLVYDECLRNNDVTPVGAL